MMTTQSLDTHQKALRINLDQDKYGTFAEIGAGQEVARWFFRAGGAAGTIAKTISAYDMNVSDAIYGPSDRYVSRTRLRTMLDYEYNLLQERLGKKRGATTRFFAFADTVKARSYNNVDESHGWMGIRFQEMPHAQPSEVIVHVRMLDRENLLQQEALGILGVNLIYGALYLHQFPEQILQTLFDNLGPGRLEVDMIKFSGAAFSTVDNRVMSLLLVEKGLANAAMFLANGEVVQPGDLLYKRPILVERGSFRPITNATVNMLACAKTQFLQQTQIQDESLVVLMEITMKNLTTESGIDPKDFLERVDILGTLGKPVLISNYGEYYRLASYLFRYTTKPIGIVMGIPSLREIFDERYYSDLQGGILESFGRLFKNELRLYVYPFREGGRDSLVTAETLEVARHLRHLYNYLLENHFIESITNFDPACLPVFSRDVLARIGTGDATWEAMVPNEVARIIKDRQLLGYKPSHPTFQKA